MTWERALEADARLAARNAVLVRAALRQQFDAERAYQGYLNTTPNLELNLVQQRARARAWAIINIRPNLEPLKAVIEKMWGEGLALGYAAAGEALQEAQDAQKADTRGVIDWSKWKPGDEAAALTAKKPGLLNLLQRAQGFTWKGFSDTTLNDIGNSIGEAIALGLDAKRSAKLIMNHVASPARALSIAITEQNRAISYATSVRYRDAGVQKMQWLVFDPCKICAQNANQIVDIGQQFPSGDQRPPAHPNCRCALAPVIPGFDEQQAMPGATIVTPPPPPAPIEVAAEVVEAVTPVAVSTAFVPGQWTKLSRIDIENRLIDSYMAASPRYSRSEIIDFFQQGRVKKADLAMIKSGRVLKNGPIEVEFYSVGAKVTPAAEKKLLEGIEELQKYMPKEKMTFIVASERGNAYGSAILGDAKIWLKPSTVMDSKPLKAEVGFKMPSISTVPHRDYTLAHEWGHTVDIGGTLTRNESIQNSLTTMKIERLRKEFKDNPDAFVSRYSEKNTKEFYAEMFAEFFLTKGQTNNPLVLAMAKEFNWKTATPVVKPPALLTSNKTSAERNLEINQQIDELKAKLGKDISDERLLNAVKRYGSQGEIDSTDLVLPLRKKFEQAGLTVDEAKTQTEGYLMRVAYYLENKEALPKVLKAIDEMDPAEAARFNARAGVVKQRILNAMQMGKVTIGVNRVAFKSIFEDGRFKSQFESKTSGGLLDPYIRKTREKTTFDIDVNTPDNQRPIYGYITDNRKAMVPGQGETINDALNNVLSVWNRNAMQYGEYKIILKDSVKNRATVTIGDSLRRGLLGENVLEPKPDLVNMGYWTYGAPPRTVGLPDFSYLETQIHGGVTIDDIEAIILPMNETSLGFKEVQEIIQNSGRDIKVIAGGAGE